MARTRRKTADQVLLQALACGATVENAARKAGVSERTVYRRLECPAFCEQLRQFRTDMVQRTAGLLTGAGMGSVKTLVDLQQDVAVPATVRRRSARDILEMGVKLRESADLEQRLADLEARLAAGQRPHNQSIDRTHSTFQHTPIRTGENDDYD
jgi:hypothetical protein